MLAYPQVYPKQNGQVYIPGFTSFTSPIPGSIESELIDPVYTLGDSMNWTHGRHSIKFGFQVDYTSTNSYNINNNVTPAVYLRRRQHRGAGSQYASRSGFREPYAWHKTYLPILPARYRRSAQGFGVANGKNPQWIVYPSRAAFEQRDANGFINDNFKATKNLTVNIGMRWDWAGVPWEKWGRMLEPTNGFAGAFGISGTNFNALWSPGASGGSLTQMETVGADSANPGTTLYKNYYKGFEPIIGLNWAIPYFGVNKTVLRVGYGMSRPMTLSFLDISGDVTQFATSATYSAVAPTFLNGISLPLSPTFSNPLQIWPINDKTQSIAVTDPNFKPTVVQNWNASLERQLTPSLTLAIRYVGNRTTHQPGNFSMNTANVDTKRNRSRYCYSPRRERTRRCSTRSLMESLSPALARSMALRSPAPRRFCNTPARTAYFAGNSAGSMASFLQHQPGLGAGRNHAGPRLAAGERRLAGELRRGQSAVFRRNRRLRLSQLHLQLGRSRAH